MTAPALPASSAEHTRLTRQTAALSVGVAGFLIVLKAWAWFASSSVAMLASLADSMLDLAASLFTYFAVRYAAAPPDREHRFGHGKAEAFAGLIQAGLVAVSAVLIGLEALSRFLAPRPIAHGDEGLMVMGISIVVTIALVYAQTRALKRTGSIATRADRMHYGGDVAANVVVVVGLGAGAYFGLAWADAAAGALVALWLAWGALHVSGEAADHLLDRELPDADRERIRALAEADPRFGRVHELRTRTSGPYVHIQFHAELDPQMTLEEAHKLVVAAEDRIRAQYPTADIIIHPDPRGRAEPHGHEDFEPRSASSG
ncbi:MAG TPA: cation diffusion facilitator family transporter [Caulobacterales bacterium]|nr:cation diffusion facilitator family transporter [Caulobacterales bacterium]